MPRPDLLSLPFDTYQRYRLVADLVGQLERADRRLRVLDVGGRTAILRDFLPDAEVHLVDVEPSEAPGLVLGSGCALPFADDAFDAVTACDTLEHVPAELREDFVREACRICRSWVVLAGPYRSREVVEAEELLRIFLREKLGTEHRYLDEHAERGLPDLSATTGTLEGSGARVECIGHANLERWLALMSLSMYLDHDPQLRDVAKRYYRFYNQALYASDHAAPVYRHAVVGCLAGAPRPSRDELLAPPVAPAGSLDAFHQLVSELVAFDREKEVYQTERTRLFQVNEALAADLDGHRASMADIATQLEELQDGNEQVVANLEQQLNEYQAVLGDLEKDLSSHGKLVRALQVEIEERIAGQAALEAELLRVNELASEEHQANRELRRQLKSRLKNLRRALSPRPPEY